MTEIWQGSVVAIGNRAILIEGPPGIGKSSLALGLIDRGAMLVGDDCVVLEVRGDTLIAKPHPNTRGLIEVRNVGLVTLPVMDEARLCLVLQLREDAPRFVDEPGKMERLGIELPVIGLWPTGGNPAIKAELALEKFGLAEGRAG